MHQLNIVLGAGLAVLLVLFVAFAATVGRRYDRALRRRGDDDYVDAAPIWIAGGISDGGSHCSSDGGGGSCDGGGGS